MERSSSESCDVVTSSIRICERIGGLARLAQHHVVIQVPMKNARSLELRKLFDLQLERAAAKAQLFRRVHQGLERVAAAGAPDCGASRG